jgi:spheroidene monooxygenase
MPLQRTQAADAHFAASVRPAEPARAGPSPFSGDVSVLVVARMRASDIAWGWSRLVRGPGRLRREPGLRFARVLGSGHEGRFGLRPSASVQGLFAVFHDTDAAEAFVARSDELEAWRAHAREIVVARLRAFSSRGSWGGQTIGVGQAIAPHGRVASLTRASIRLRRAVQFWRRAPPAQASLDAAEGCLFAVGLGEAPLLRQATFSVWESAPAMDAYARSGAHLDAIRAARAGDHFAESMFVRFELLSLAGTWKGQAIG